MNALYLIDKPIGISSFDVIRDLRKKLQIRKMWHTWTLDPLATGGLLVAVWNYTKLIPYFEKDKKTYEFTIKLDWVTDSYDLAEEVKYISESEQKEYKNELTQEKIQSIIHDKFTGKITQIPPKYSALKIWGKKACDLVRQGKNVEIKSRKIEIYNIEILSYSYPELEIQAEVSAGTYIRSIAADLWDILWTGWYISKLRRIKIGELSIALWQNLESFDSEKVLDIKQVFANKWFVHLDKEILEKLNHGLRVKWDFLAEDTKEYFVENNGEVTHIVKQQEGVLIPIKKI